MDEASLLPAPGGGGDGSAGNKRRGSSSTPPLPANIGGYPGQPRALVAARPPSRQVIYEMHVRGFTRDDSSKVASPGAQGGGG